MSFESLSNQAYYIPAKATAKKILSIKASYGTPKFAVIDENETYLITAQKDKVFYYQIGDGTLTSAGSIKSSGDIGALATYGSDLYGISQEYLWVLENIGNQPKQGYNFKPSKNELVGEICFYKTEGNPLYVLVMDVKGKLCQTENGAVMTAIELTDANNHRDYDTNFTPQMTLLDGYLFYLEYNTSPNQAYLRCIDPDSMKEVTSSKLLLPKVSKYGYIITAIAPTGKKPYLLLTNPTNMLTINPPGKTYSGGAFKYFTAKSYQGYVQVFPYITTYESMELEYHPSPPIYDADTDRIYCISFYHLPMVLSMNSAKDGSCAPEEALLNASNWVMDKLVTFFWGYPQEMISSWYGSFMNKLLDHAPFPDGEKGFSQLLKENILKDRLGPWDSVLKMDLQKEVLSSGLDFEDYYKKYIEPSLPLGTSPHSIKPFPESMAFGYVLLYLCYLAKLNLDQCYVNKAAEGMAPIVKALTDSKYLSLIGSELSLNQVLLFSQFFGPMPTGVDPSIQKNFETADLKDALATQAYLGLVCGNLTKEGISTPVPLPHFIFAANKDKIYRVSTVESTKLGIAFSQMSFKDKKYEYTFVNPSQPNIATSPYSSMHLYDNRLYIIGANSISLYTLPES